MTVVAFQLCPKWVAPNVLTFSGWALLLFILLVTTFFDPHFTAASGSSNTSYHMPQIFWLLFGIAQFVSHTLDGCDGKQARRTNSRYSFVTCNSETHAQNEILSWFNLAQQNILLLIILILSINVASDSWSVLVYGKLRFMVNLSLWYYQHSVPKCSKTQLQ